MIKKALCTAAIAGVLGTFVFGRDVISYVTTWGSSVRTAVKSEVPVQFEIQRAREMVENLVPDIRRCMHVIAEQQVDIEDLARQVDRKSENILEQKSAILALRSDLNSGKSKFTYASRTYTSDEVKRDLANRFSRYKVAEDTLKREEQILRARENAMASNQEKLERMLSAKKDLEVQIEQLEARLKAVEAAETVSTLEIDHSQLARTKKLIRDLNKQLDVKEKLMDAEGKFTGLIPVETETDVPANIEEQVDTYFKDEPADINSSDLNL